MRNVELLIPAGNLENLKIAVAYGADAVYVGGEVFSLRAKATNFSMEDLKEGIEYAHIHNVKVYVTVNILAHNEDIEQVKEYLKELGEIKPDGLIIADPGIFSLAKRLIPHVERHISTQANNTNYETYLFWWELGAKRVVSARELSLAEIAEIRSHIPEEMEIESFVHGAMCMAYSGRCSLSNYMTGRDANQGACSHPCRWNYSIMEEKRPGEYFPVYENERGSYIFNSKDLCMIEHIPEMIEAGIDSLKIEGRMKTTLYTATVARTYRKAIDDYLESPEKYKANMEWYKDEIGKCTYRNFTTGFYFGKVGEDAQIYDANLHITNYIYLGQIQEVNEKGQFKIQQKNKFSVGETIELMKPDGSNILCTVNGIYNEDGQAQESAPHSKQILWIQLNEDVELKKHDIIRKKA
ncbi:MAG: U32 family peptidase [Clostridium butyricum]|nr:U32 family peptidase [Clostridium butyricum]